MTNTQKVLTALGIVAGLAGIYAFTTRKSRSASKTAGALLEADREKDACSYINSVLSAVPKEEMVQLLNESSDWDLTSMVDKIFSKLHKEGKMMDVGNNPFSMTRAEKIEALRKFWYYADQVAKECKQKFSL